MRKKIVITLLVMSAIVLPVVLVSVLPSSKEKRDAVQSDVLNRSEFLGESGVYDFMRFNWNKGLGYFVTGTPSQWMFGNDATTTAAAELEIDGGLYVDDSTSTNSLVFLGEIRPDGDLCTNGQILKKTGTDDWDCAADNNSGGGGGAAWEQIFINTITPTNTSAGIYVRASSTIDSDLRVNGFLRATSSLDFWLNATSSLELTTLELTGSLTNYYGSACSAGNNFISDVADNGDFTCTALSTSGDWTGTLDGREGVAYIDWTFPFDLAIRPSTTNVGLFVQASSTIEANFRVQGNATTTATTTARGFKAENLVSCNTIDTNAEGHLVCGSDETGGAGGGYAEFTQVGSNQQNVSSTPFLFANGLQASSSANILFDRATITDSVSADKYELSGDFLTSFSSDATIDVVSNALRAVDLTCTDCLNATEIEDIFFLTAGDTMSNGTSSDSFQAVKFTTNGTNYISNFIGDGLDLSSNALIFDCSDVVSTGLQCSGEDLQLNATGDWTGTFDGLEGTSYAKTGFNGAWERIFTSDLTPTSTSAGIFVRASSTVQVGLRVDGSATTSVTLVIGNTNPVGNGIGDLYVGGNATTSNVTFTGEILPDGLSCSVGQILKKTADDNWDCATDNSSGGEGAAGAWEEFTLNTLRPTNTSAGLIVNASSTFGTSLRVDGRTTSTQVMWIGDETGTPTNLSMTGGDLFVQDDLEVDDDIFFTSTQILIGQSGGWCFDFDGTACTPAVQGIRFGDNTDTAIFEIEDAAVCIGVSGCTAAGGVGELYLEDNLEVGAAIVIDEDDTFTDGGTTGSLIIGDGTDTGDFQLEDGPACIGDGGCTVFSADGSLNVEVLLGIATTTPFAGMELAITGQVAIDGLTSAPNTLNSVCIDGTSNEIFENAASSCLVSTKRSKENIEPLDINVRKFIQKLKPSQYNDKFTKEPRVGLIAEDVYEIEPRLVDLDADGRPQAVRYQELTAVLVKALQDIYSSPENKNGFNLGYLGLLGLLAFVPLRRRR